MKSEKAFNSRDLNSALNKMAILRYWPSDPSARAEIGILLAKMVPSKEALEWLADTVVNQVGEWPGPAELRGLLCWKFQPADGVERHCSLTGFTTADGERFSVGEHVYDDSAIEGWSRELLDSMKPKRLM